MAWAIGLSQVDHLLVTIPGSKYQNKVFYLLLRMKYTRLLKVSFSPKSLKNREVKGDSHQN